MWYEWCEKLIRCKLNILHRSINRSLTLWPEPVRGHRKSSQKPSETKKKLVSLEIKPPPSPEKNKVRTSGFNCQTNVYTKHHLKPKVRFFRKPHPPPILFVSLGFCKLLRWFLKCNGFDVCEHCFCLVVFWINCWMTRFYCFTVPSHPSFLSLSLSLSLSIYLSLRPLFCSLSVSLSLSLSLSLPLSPPPPPSLSLSLSLSCISSTGSLCFWGDGESSIGLLGGSQNELAHLDSHTIRQLQIRTQGSKSTASPSLLPALSSLRHPICVNFEIDSITYKDERVKAFCTPCEKAAHYGSTTWSL